MILKNPAENLEFANFFTKLTACFGDLQRFEQQIQQIAEIIGIDLSQFEIDHLAVRMNDRETAQHWRNMLLDGGKLLKESEINGRPIGLFQLNQPLMFCSQSVSVIELPFPKGKTYPKEGWEHIEVVVPFLAGEKSEQWLTRLYQQFRLANNPQLKLKLSEPKGEGERLANPTLAISLNSATSHNSCCLKLHPYSIQTIVQSEQSS